MDRMAKEVKAKFYLLFIATFVCIFFFTVRIPRSSSPVPEPRWAPDKCPAVVSKETLTPLTGTKHLLVSAFVDWRVKGFASRIIAIFRRDSVQPLYCLFCCSDWLSAATPATVLQHSDNFGFPYVTTDVLCPAPDRCNATHVTLLTQQDRRGAANHIWLPIRNQRGSEEKKLQFNFTVCVSNLFGRYNNVLQFAQTLEMYRLLGVNRVVIYNTSCGPELDRLLRGYVQEGFLEVVPWPIDQHLTPSPGWLFSQSGGDVHYFGQLATLNECVYRSMERSRYVLLNDIDEIIMPYRHQDLPSLMDALQQQHPQVGVFLIENHIFPKTPFEESKRGPLPTWRGVPGFNILQHVFREEPDRSVYHPHKMIVRPRSVEQTSVHEVLKAFGGVFKVPPDVCRIIHSPLATPTRRPLELLRLDTRLWDFRDRLLPRTMEALRRGGLLRSGGRS